jgi:hypothetical protein
VFNREKHQHTFGDSAGDRSGFITDLSIFAWDHSATLTRKNVIMVNIEELSEEDQRKYTGYKNTSSSNFSLAPRRIVQCHTLKFPISGCE